MAIRSSSTSTASVAGDDLNIDSVIRWFSAICAAGVAVVTLVFLIVELRYVHLEAHLKQRSLLSDEQVAKYDQARGYHR